MKIAPGVKINVGKRGFSSVSVGHMNFGRRGVYQNFNIPGTGITYRAQLMGRHKQSRPVATRPANNTKDMTVSLHLYDDGSVTFLDQKGKPLPDSLIVAAKKQHREKILEWLHEHANEFNAEIETLLNIHLTTPAPYGEVIVNPKPIPPETIKAGGVFGLFESQRRKADEANRRAQLEYDQELKKWEQAENALKSDPEVMASVLSGALASIEWPRETSVSFDIRDDGQTVLLDVDLPEIEDMPDKEAHVNSKEFMLTLKERSQTQRQVEYVKHIHAIGFRLIGDVFACLPSISMVVFSGYSQRASKMTGRIEDEYLYSVRVSRDGWERIDFTNLELIDVVEAFERFDLRRNISKRGVITPIQPFDK